MKFPQIEDLELPSVDEVSSPVTKKLINAISKADKYQSSLTIQAASLEGMSSVKVRCLLNQLCVDPKTRYMEIGTWKGSTLISALCNNNPEYHVAIDNFGECGIYADEINDTLWKNCRNILGKEPNHLRQDSFKVDTKKEGIKGINVYLYDGCHSREATRHGIAHYYDCLADEFILLVDDWNRAAVATGTLEGISDTNLKMNFARILPANGDGDPENWWSGMFVASCTKR